MFESLKKIFNKQPEYQTKTVVVDVEGVNHYAVAFCLANLAGFKNHSVMLHGSFSDGRKTKSAVVYHENLIKKHPHGDYPAYENPDIEVYEKLNKKFEITFSNRVDSSLVDKIESELKARKV